MDRRVAVSCVLVGCLFLLGCPRKPPRTAAAPDPTTAPAPAEPTPPVDPTEQPLPSDLRQLNEELLRRGLLGDVHFAFDQSALDGAARERLERNADFLREHTDYLLTIEGHCDERGTNDYNLALGERRSAAALDFLAGLGVGAERLRTVSYGEERPQCTESSEPCWARNRRAHFVVVGRRAG